MQIAREIFVFGLTIMKEILLLAEFKMGKDTEDYKYFKRKIMDVVYENLRNLFKNFESENILQKCSCKTKIRQGYDNSCNKCNGAGYMNSEAMKNKT